MIGGLISHFNYLIGNTRNFNMNNEGSGSGSFLGTVVDANVNTTT